MSKLVLASGSPRRQEILAQLGVQFEILPSDIDEVIPEGVPAAEVASHLALQKAKNVARKVGYPSLVIGADTIVVLDGEILGKPSGREQAFEMLSKLAGREHDVITGVAVVDSCRGIELKDYEITRVKMKKVSRDRINKYIKTGEPLDKAGAYAVQGKASIFVEKIEGCYFNVVGLPVSKLDSMLCSIGIDLFK
jgi:septum formation protein